MVSYANRGGGKAAQQLQQVLLGIQMNVTEANLEIKLSDVNFSQSDDVITYPDALSLYEDKFIMSLNQMYELHTRNKNLI